MRNKIKRPTSTIELDLDKTLLEHKKLSLGAKGYPAKVELKFGPEDAVDISDIEGDTVSFNGTGDFELDIETIVELLRSNRGAIKSFKCTLDE